MRLDIYLTEQSLAKSRSKAQSAIAEGRVTVNGIKITKASFDVQGDEAIAIIDDNRFVSRAGDKLAHALEAFNIDVNGLIALDIGASTGGFTDCLLQNGAKKVYALDVGSGQLDEKLRSDDRVVVIENFNARYAKREDFIDEIDFICMDVSFISQTLIYPAISEILSSGKSAITLIKPQFEAGKSQIGKGGIVKDKDGKIIKSILEKLDFSANAYNLKRVNFTDSPIQGGDGNFEYLAHFVKNDEGVIL